MYPMSTHSTAGGQMGCLPANILVVTLPCVVVPVVHSDGVAEAGERSVQLLCQNKLVPQQSVGVCKAWVHLTHTGGHLSVGRCPLTCGEDPQYSASYSKAPFSEALVICDLKVSSYHICYLSSWRE